MGSPIHVDAKTQSVVAQSSAETVNFLCSRFRSFGRTSKFDHFHRSKTSKRREDRDSKRFIECTKYCKAVRNCKEDKTHSAGVPLHARYCTNWRHNPADVFTKFAKPDMLIIHIEIFA